MARGNKQAEKKLTSRCITFRLDEDLKDRIERLRLSQAFPPSRNVIVRAALIKLLDEWEANQ